mmetsp:Transcript_20365/g.46191  ORF Transcript_20365/g.46191 Transcript_20365/m.46191 type:complete len:462 (-) Transcript_20365:831-2216(-)
MDMAPRESSTSLDPLLRTLPSCPRILPSRQITRVSPTLTLARSGLVRGVRTMSRGWEGSFSLTDSRTSSLMSRRSSQLRATSLCRGSSFSFSRMSRRASSRSSILRENFLASSRRTAALLASSSRRASSSPARIWTSSSSCAARRRVCRSAASFCPSRSCKRSPICRVSSSRSSRDRSSTRGGSSSRLATARANDSPTAPGCNRYVGRPSTNCIPATANRWSEAASCFSSRKWVVTATLAPASSSSSRSACAMATPCLGSVPLPISSMSTRLRRPLRRRTSRHTSMCPENVLRSPSTLCMSPMSARTSKKSTLAPGSAGTGTPSLAISASSPRSFSTTVLPPELGPVRTSPARPFVPTSRWLGTTCTASVRRESTGCRAPGARRTPSSPTSGTDPARTSPRRTRARTRSSCAAAATLRDRCSRPFTMAWVRTRRRRRSSALSSASARRASLVGPTSSGGST